MPVISAIGAGNMAGAILDGAVAGGVLSPGEIGFSETNPQRAAEMARRGYTAFDSLEHLCAQSRYILLSVKPQAMTGVLEDLRPHLESHHVLISIAAGLSEEYFCRHLGDGIRLVLVMPNTPILVGQGATAVARCEPVSQEEFGFVKKLFGSGTVREIPKDKLNEVIAISGSTPAYLYLIAKHFCDRAVASGLDYDTANALFSQTMIGAATMMTQTGKTPRELITMVSSPGGTTLAGLEVLEGSDLEQIIADCTAATIKRAYELGQ